MVSPSWTVRIVHISTTSVNDSHILGLCICLNYPETRYQTTGSSLSALEFVNIKLANPMGTWLTSPYLSYINCHLQLLTSPLFESHAKKKVSFPNWKHKGNRIDLRNRIQPSQMNIWQSYHITLIVKFILMHLISDIFYFQRKTTKPCFHLMWYTYSVEMITTLWKMCTESCFVVEWCSVFSWFTFPLWYL